MLRSLGVLVQRHRFAVIGLWIAVAAVLNVTVPQLEQTVKQADVPFVPGDSPVMRAYSLEGSAFREPARGYVVVVLEDQHGLNQADQDYYARLVQRLRAHPERVSFVQDFISHPELRPQVTSRDGKAIYLTVGLRHAVGSPQGDSDAPWVREQVAPGRPASLRAYLAGDTAVIADYQKSIEDTVTAIEAISGLLVVAILLLVYRSPVTPLVPLATIGLAVAVVRPVVSLLGEHLVHVSAFTEVFLMSIVFGAGTDYCIFLISRFEEQLGQGDDQPAAITGSLGRIGEAITGSAITVIVGGVAMSTASIALFSTTGPAVAAAVVVTLLAGLTLTPALMAVGGRRILWPHGVRTRPSRFWTWAAAVTTTRPRAVLTASLAPLVLLAGILPFARITFDERTPQPAGNPDLVAMDVMAKHFPPGTVMPDTILIRSSHDLRDSADLAALDLVTQRLRTVPGVVSVSSFTEPQGRPIPEASIPGQARGIGLQLGQAHDSLAASSGDIGRLGEGAAQLSSGAGQAEVAAQQIATGLGAEDAGLGQASAGAGQAQGGASRLADGARQLSAGLRAERSGIQAAVDQLTIALLALQGDPIATTSGAYQRVKAVRDAERDQVLPGLDQAIAGSDRIAAGDSDLAAALGQLRDGVAKAQAGVEQLKTGQDQLASGLGTLSAGAAEVGGGAGQLSSGVRQLQGGLGQAADYLKAAGAEAQTPGLDTFFVPPDRLDDPELALSRAYFLSADGRVARILVAGRDNPFGNAAMQRGQRERQVTELALGGTSLAGSEVLMSGDPALNADLQAYYDHDFRAVGVAVLVGVLLVLVVLLRSAVAPVYLLLSVLLSYAASIGLTVLVWQVLLHKAAIDWTVPIFAFVMLVAVGADYNIFLVTRVREEVARDPVDGVRRAIVRTGSIITSAGLIFAGSFAALSASPVASIAETGFAIAAGVILDTLVVRSFLVPALTVLFGRWSWWPAGAATGGVEPRRRFEIA